MNDEEIFEELKMRRLVPALRERVGRLRRGIKPGIQTTYTALDVTAQETPTLRLIRREARALLQEELAFERERPITNGIGYGLSLQDELALAAA